MEAQLELQIELKQKSLTSSRVEIKDQGHDLYLSQTDSTAKCVSFSSWYWTCDFRRGIASRRWPSKVGKHQFHVHPCLSAIPLGPLLHSTFPLSLLLWFEEIILASLLTHQRTQHSAAQMSRQQMWEKRSRAPLSMWNKSHEDSHQVDAAIFILPLQLQLSSLHSLGWERTFLHQRQA